MAQSYLDYYSKMYSSYSFEQLYQEFVMIDNEMEASRRNLAAWREEMYRQKREIELLKIQVENLTMENDMLFKQLGGAYQ